EVLSGSIAVAGRGRFQVTRVGADAYARRLAAEVEARVRAGTVNVADDRTSRTLSEILRANILTRFNAILGMAFVLILMFGEGQDALFGIVLLFNTLIGVVQEWRAKRTLDRLAVLNAPRARVVRDGAVREVAVGEVVLDDLCVLVAGDQVAADGILRQVEGLELDESMLTGESDPVAKDEGDEVLSGSIAVAGRGRFQVTRVGADAYARRLAAEARRFTRTRSELMDGINQILRYVQWALVPTAVLLAFSQFKVQETNRAAIAGVVAGVVAMVPEGLVLLTSLAFGVAAVSLARRQVLVQELPAVEGLARVDVILLDKTGTLTQGVIGFHEVHQLDPDAPVSEALGALANDENRNATMNALSENFPPPEGWERIGSTPFSSGRKWSAAMFRGRGTWVFGAPEMIWVGHPKDDPVRGQADQLAAEGRRVLLLAHTDAPLSGESLPEVLRAAALIVFEEEIRPDAADTLRYFAEQGVRCMIISGDNPHTVGAIARRVGVEGGDRAYDARELPEDPERLAEVLADASVFGRVTPQQKRAIVGALQRRGHVVAMTGDGVNDALALKDADIGVAMGSGAPATRAVAQVVLLDGRFASMPGVVAEGRRVIANVERVANLFVTKTFYAMILAIAIGAARWPYPFLPRHLTIVSSLTIGIPAFFLALAPNNRRYEPGFVRRVLLIAAPAGAVAAAATFVSYAIARRSENVLDSRTAATITLLIVGLWVLNLLARPITPGRAVLFGVMVAAFVLILGVPSFRDWFALNLPTGTAMIGSIACAAAGVIALESGWQLRQWRMPPDRRTARWAWHTAGGVQIEA
ncbi:MAG: cation-transporting P-type ATPase, partial [Actinomycetota bacterium]|nr:cation-transporting P-type ATPase [Actinomycetota bacterium]